MQPTPQTAILDWVKELPPSTMVYPENFFDRLKYVLWRLYTPYHSFFRDTLLKLGIIHHEERQSFLLGKLAPGRSLMKLISFLINQGYGNHFIAWKDEGQLVSLRLVKNFTYQYHLRIFEDGEIRGHYEYTPECHPFLHLQEKSFEDRHKEFSDLLRGWIIPA